MSELIQETTDEGWTVHYRKYTRDELRAAWGTDGQGHRQAVARGRDCVVEPCADDETALRYTAACLRHAFAIPTCYHYDGTTFSAYAGDAGSGWRECMLSFHKAISDINHNRVPDIEVLFASA